MKQFLLILAMGMIVGCEDNQEFYTHRLLNIQDKQVEEAKNSQRYFKDSYGICYSLMISSSHMGYYIASHTTVPCEKVGL